MHAWTRSAALAALALSAPLAAQQPSPPAAPGYTMPFTHMWDMPSDSGEIYRIFVSYPAPETKPPEGGFPVLYVLDGNASFASFAETRRLVEYAATGKAIVVGVGYPTDKAYDGRRLADLSPALPNPLPPGWAHLGKYKSGERDKFLNFLTGKLRTEIARRYTVNLERQSLFGHSLGGIFGLYALYTQPGAFHSIVAASPSMDWVNQSILKEERDFTAKLVAGKVPRTSRLLVVVGDNDVDDDPDPSRLLVDRLERLSANGMRARLRVYEKEIHITVPARAVTDTLRFVFEQN